MHNAPDCEEKRHVSMRNTTVHDRPGRRAGLLPWLHAYTVFVALSILVLICSGGMVTSKNAGLAVPDWPNSYGYNMFAFPVSRWVGRSRSNTPTGWRRRRWEFSRSS